jgi:hypothetical protein
MVQAVSHRPLTAQTRLRYQVIPCKICDGQSGTGTGFSPNTSLFRCSTNGQNPFTPTGFSYHKDKRAKSAHLPLNYTLSEIVEHFIKKVLPLDGEVTLF